METMTANGNLTSSEKLAEIFEFIRGSAIGKVAACRRIACELHQFIMPNKNWSWRYIHQVMNGKLTPSTSLKKAIDQLYRVYKPSTSSKTEFVQAIVYAPEGLVTANTFLTISPRICRWSSCGSSFIPRSPNHQYCTPQCRNLLRRAQHASADNPVKPS